MKNGVAAMRILFKTGLRIRCISRRGVVLLGLLAGGCLPALAQAADAAQPSAHAIHIHDCWIRLLPGKLPSAAYFRVTNAGQTAVALTAVSTPAYARTMLHATTTAQGMSHMRHVQRVTVPAQDHVDFAPGGYHVMLEQAARKIAVGDAIPMTFRFAQGAPVHADCTVRAANAMQSERQQHHQH